MPDYSVGAVFDAVDNMSGVASGIASSFNSAADSMFANAGNMTQGFDALGIAGGLALTGLSTLTQFLGQGFDQWMQTDEAMARVSAQTGLTGQALEDLKQHAGNLFSSGLVKNFDDAARAVQDTSKWVKGLSDPTVFDEFDREAAGVAKGFGITADKVVIGVGKMQAVFPELKDKPIEALDLLTTTAQKSGLPLGDIINTVEKFGPRFLGAGIDAMGMGGMIVLAAQAGLSDRALGALPGAIDTFENKLANPSPAFKAALKDLGLGQVADDVKTHKITIEQAVDEVFTAIKGGKVPTDNLNTDVKALFGNVQQLGGAETLGKLAGFSDALGGPSGVSGGAKKATDSMTNTFGGWINQQRDAFSQASSDFFDRLFTGLVWIAHNIGPGLQLIGDQVGNWIAETAGAIGKGVTDWWNDLVKRTKDAIASVSAAFKSVVDAVTGILNGILTAINNIVAALASINGSVSPDLGSKLAAAYSQHATGGYLDPGWNMVGEKGPELIFGATGQVFPIAGGGGSSAGAGPSIVGKGGGGGGGTTVAFNLPGTTVVDMQTFMQQAYLYWQQERDRRGLAQ